MNCQNLSSSIALEALSIDIGYPATDDYSTPVPVVKDLSFKLRIGEVVTIIGESGCGKSSLVAALARLIPISGGQVRLFGENYTYASHGRMRDLRRHLQLMLQDATGTFDQRLTIGQTIRAPMRWIRNEWSEDECRASLARVLYITGLDERLLDRPASKCSGGQLKRAALARALVSRPSVLLLDEPFAGLDLESRHGITGRLWADQAKHPMAILLVSHQIPPEDNTVSRVMVLSEGQLEEQSSRNSIYE
ncbi:MAG: ATP-binding cassette domain-containing protein [Candidatus Thiodiazotropha sp.]